MSEFASFWAEHHPKAPPIGYILRDMEPDIWVRFHSLPRSKRYPTSKRETKIVLDRANRLASRVLGNAAPCWLVQANAGTNGPSKEYPFSFASEYLSADDECVYQIFAAPVAWMPGSFDDLLSQIANDEIWLPTMWVSAATGVAFAPYDGGSDLFLATPGEMKTIKGEFAKWLSTHPTGL